MIDKIWRDWADMNAISFSVVSPHIHGRKIIETLGLIGQKFSNKAEEDLVKAIAQEAMKSAKEVEGALHFIQSLPESSWSIATSGPRIIAETSLLAAGFYLPKAMVCSEDVTFGKPNPEPFSLAAKLIKIEPKYCVAFEDSPAGIESAKAAGCFTVAILTSHSQSELSRADVIVSSFSRLRCTQTASGLCLHWT
jgi:sugar-phosphatase